MSKPDLKYVKSFRVETPDSLSTLFDIISEPSTHMSPLVSSSEKHGLGVMVRNTISEPYGQELGMFVM